MCDGPKSLTHPFQTPFPNPVALQHMLLCNHEHSPCLHGAPIAWTVQYAPCRASAHMSMALAEANSEPGHMRDSMRMARRNLGFLDLVEGQRMETPPHQHTAYWS